MRQPRWATLLGVVVVVAASGRTLAETRPEEGNAVVARVGGEPIRAGEVRRLLAGATGGKAVSPAAKAFLEAQVLEEIVNRRLVLAYARGTGSEPTAAEIDAATADLDAKLKSQNRSRAEFLKSGSITEEDLRRQLAWNVVWEKYRARYVTATRIEQYFRTHRRELDGSRVSVSQILLAPAATATPEDIAALVKQAQDIRRRIISGEISFADAAEKHSAAPSGKQGGRLGDIARHGAMDEAFSRAAFALDVGQVSGPVRSPFGVHLIRCDAIKPGGKQLADVGAEVEDALARELVEKLSQTERRHTPVEYTGAMPYFRPGTRDVVCGRSPGQ